MSNGAISFPHVLSTDTPYPLFPDPTTALKDPDGLLAIGGDLHPQRILHAYRQGIFPWYSEGQPILWWSPDPRSVLFPEKLKVSRSLKKSSRNKDYSVTFNQACPDVIHACAATRPQPVEDNSDEYGTWLTKAMIQAYTQLHSMGYVHSAECWHNDQLVGGLYGIKIGNVFFGESMFSTKTDASKVAFVAMAKKLQQSGCVLIDCQVHSEHIGSLGAEEIPRQHFLDLLKQNIEKP